MPDASPYADLLDRLVEGENSGDADRVAALVAEDYRSETPVHPSRNFTGREQVRRNWETLFENTTEFEAEVLRSAAGEGTLWAEWRLTGTQTDGSPLEMRGVAIMGVADDEIQWGRIYLEPVETGGDETWEEVYAVDNGSGTAAGN